MNQLLKTMRADALLWTAVALTVSLASLSSISQIALAVLAAVCVACLPQPTYVRAASAFAMLPLAIPDTPAWILIATGGLLATVLARSAADAVPTPLERIQRHLEWCRRRGEPAHLLWVHAPGVDRETAAAALEAFRITDNPALLHTGDEIEEIVAMVDDANFERSGLERRLRTHVGEAAGFGWVTFPDDGVTLESLFQLARAAAVTSSQPIRPGAQLFASFRRWGNTTPTRAARSSNQG